jgi:hypothetical protein
MKPEAVELVIDHWVRGGLKIQYTQRIELR